MKSQWHKSNWSKIYGAKLAKRMLVIYFGNFAVRSENLFMIKPYKPNRIKD